MVGRSNQGQSISISDGWFELPQQPDPMAEGWRRTFILTGDSDVTMAFSYRGNPVDKSSAEALREILTAKPAAIGDEKLTPQEIILLRDVMDYETAGNNQYTNSAKPGAPGGPVFDLIETSTRRVVSRTVLYIRGSLRSGRQYAGIFYDADSSGQVIEEFVIHAPSKKELKEHIGKFETALSTIAWR